MQQLAESNLKTPKGSDYFRRKDWPLRAFFDRTHYASVPHTHDFIEIFIVLRGNGWHYSTQGKQSLRVGDTFAMRPGAWHYFHLCEDLDVYNCLIDAELFQRILSFCSQDPELRYVWWDGPLSFDRRSLLSLHLEAESVATCQIHLNEISRLDKMPAASSSVAQAAHFLLFLVELTSHLGDDYRAPLEVSSNASQCVEQCVSLMESKLSYPWTIEKLCKELHISRYHLMHVFKHRMGASPMTYLARRRAERAAQLLMSSDVAINQIALQVGWNDPNYFARRFKDHFGISAMQYRKKLEEGDL